jgi:NADH-quinone oxidoreductase subunit K
MTSGSVFWDISAGHYLVLSMILFAIGVVGALIRRNALIVLMSVELMLNAGNLALLAFARQRHDMAGQAMQAQGLAMIVIAVAAAEAAVGLAIVVSVFRSTRHANVDRLTTLKY